MMEGTKLFTHAGRPARVPYSLLSDIRAMPSLHLPNKLSRGQPVVCRSHRAPLSSAMPGMAATLVALKTLPAHAGPLMVTSAGAANLDVANMFVIAALGFSAFGIINWQLEQANNRRVLSCSAISFLPVSALCTAVWRGRQTLAPITFRLKNMKLHLEDFQVRERIALSSSGRLAASEAYEPETPAAANVASTQLSAASRPAAAATLAAMPASAPTAPLPPAALPPVTVSNVKPAAAELAAAVAAPQMPPAPAPMPVLRPVAPAHGLPEPAAVKAAVAATAPLAHPAAAAGSPPAVAKAPVAPAAVMLPRELAALAAAATPDSMWGKAVCARTAHGMACKWRADSRPATHLVAGRELVRCRQPPRGFCFQHPSLFKHPSLGLRYNLAPCQVQLAGLVQAASARAMQAAYNARLTAVHEAAIKRQEHEARRWKQHAAALASFRAPQVLPQAPVPAAPLQLSSAPDGLFHFGCTYCSRGCKYCGIMLRPHGKQNVGLRTRCIAGGYSCCERWMRHACEAWDAAVRRR